MLPAAPPLCRKEKHVMDEANTYVYPNGHRACRACKVAAEKARLERQREVRVA
jgi:hypothetical protein